MKHFIYLTPYYFTLFQFENWSDYSFKFLFGKFIDYHQKESKNSLYLLGIFGGGFALNV